MKEAMLYQKLADHKVVCSLCAHRCTLAEEKSGSAVFGKIVMACYARMRMIALLPPMST